MLFQLLFFGDPEQPGIGATNTINSFAEPRNANGVGVNTTTPPEPMVNSINSWAEVRNAEVRRRKGRVLMCSQCHKQCATLCTHDDAPLLKTRFACQ